jgi:LacI family transcriptional regulator
MLTGPDAYSTTRYRVAGFRDALREVSVPEGASRVFYGTYSPASGYALAREALASTPRPTAIFSSGSPLTSGVLRALAEARVRIPRDVSVVAYEDPEWYAISVPALTCYALPLTEMGRVAADRIVARVADPEMRARRPEVMRFAGRLVVRDSTAPPSA